MAAARPLSSAFARAAGLEIEIETKTETETNEAASSPSLEATLETLANRARAAFPELSLDAVEVSEILARRVPRTELHHEQTRVEDLVLAAKSAQGHPVALSLVETRYMPDVDHTLAKMNLGHDRIAEVKQGLRHLLFVGDPLVGTAPRILEYRGSGDLRAWMRVTAMRAALKLIRKGNREVGSDDDAILEAQAPHDDPELAYMKASYRAAFKSAFQEALDSLEPRERMLLKQQIVDGLGIDELGALYEVHRATAARWLASAREKLLTRTRRTFMLHVKVSTEECESIMRLVRSQLDVSLHRRLSAL